MAKKSRHLPLQAVELAAIQAAVAFVNLPRIESAGQVEALFVAVPLPRDVWYSLTHEPTAKAVATFEGNQAVLRQWFEQIAKRGSVKKADMQLIGELVGEAIEVNNARMTFDQSRLAVRYDLAFRGVQSAYSFAVAVLLDTQRNLDVRLGKCPLPECGKFFFDVGTHGPRQKYCSAQHANIDRQRKFRRR